MSGGWRNRQTRTFEGGRVVYTVGGVRSPPPDTMVSTNYLHYPALLPINEDSFIFISSQLFAVIPVNILFLFGLCYFTSALFDKVMQTMPMKRSSIEP